MIVVGGLKFCGKVRFDHVGIDSFICCYALIRERIDGVGYRIMQCL